MHEEPHVGEIYRLTQPTLTVYLYHLLTSILSAGAL